MATRRSRRPLLGRLFRGGARRAAGASSACALAGQLDHLGPVHRGLRCSALSRLYRGRWFLHHLLDFAIVALPLLRPLRLLRLIVLITVLQKAVGDAFRGRIVVYTVSGVLLLIYTASLAVFDKERYQHGATINSFGKALWWSITTVTTVGYGDVYPVTNTGRVIAVLLMISGISLVGVVTAALASWIIQSVAVEETASQAATAAHVDELRSEIGKLAQELQARG